MKHSVDMFIRHSQAAPAIFDPMDRLKYAGAGGGDLQGVYSEGYTYAAATGSLASKGGVTYSFNDTDHRHAVTSLTNGNTYSYDENGNMTGRTVGGQNYTLYYDAENHLTSVSGAASYVYNGDGQRVKAVVNGVTTVYIGSHYEYSLSSSTAKKYYYVGSSRIAMRDDASSLYWLLSDHLGSTMKSVKASDSTTSERRYRAWGEARFTNGTTPTNYRYTGQRGIISSLSR